jgi:formylglycine-generating enzyme required for sulfatase activity
MFYRFTIFLIAMMISVPWPILAEPHIPPEGAFNSASTTDTQLVANPVMQPGDTFQDCPNCAKMVIIPEGQFRMGDVSRDGSDNENPIHAVQIGNAFAVGVYEVTFNEWDACVERGGCAGYLPDDKGWGRSNRPVINIGWNDAKAYVNWLSEESGHDYRLLSEAEWEYVARADTATNFWWGETSGSGNANCGMCGVNPWGSQTALVGSYKPNAFGVHDVHGNVWEWVEDCWNNSYLEAPSDGSARLDGDCNARILRGGSWGLDAWDMRTANRKRFDTSNRFYNVGFRVARTLSP